MGKFLAALAVLVILGAGGVVATRILSGPEDAWKCRDGLWVRYGNPASSQPKGGCGNELFPQTGESQASGQLITRTGAAAKNLPGLAKDKLYIMYEEPGKPGLKMELRFDEKSVCASAQDPQQRIVCMALSVSDYGLANGRGISVTGVQQGEAVLVKEIRMQPQDPNAAAWEAIKHAIGSCQVTEVFQAHSLEVSAKLKSGGTLRATEPIIDAIMDEAVAAKPKCGQIIMATE